MQIAVQYKVQYTAIHMPKKEGTLAERFWSRVEQTTDCWLWTGKTREGAPRLVAFGREQRVYALAWSLVKGVSAPSTFLFDHSCRNPLCVNPDHFLPTPNKRTEGDLETRFWAKVDRSQGVDACWQWNGGLTTKGFGKVWVEKGKTVSAHKLAWELTHGSLERLKHVKHVCSNRLCVNPRHLAIAEDLSEVRFWAKVNIQNGKCWQWTGVKDRDGYGIHSVYGNKSGVKAHRYSWELANQHAIPEGLCVMHSCDNPSCVNPDHLSLGTIQDNNADRMRKDRQAKGSRSSKSKLSEAQVLQIIDFLDQGVSCYELGKRFQVSDSSIFAIKTCESWKHIPRKRG